MHFSALSLKVTQLPHHDIGRHKGSLAFGSSKQIAVSVALGYVGLASMKILFALSLSNCGIQLSYLQLQNILQIY